MTFTRISVSRLGSGKQQWKAQSYNLFRVHVDIGHISVICSHMQLYHTSLPVIHNRAYIKMLSLIYHPGDNNVAFGTMTCLYSKKA